MYRDEHPIIDFRTNDIVWTASQFESEALLDEVPYIYLTEYYQTWSATIAHADYLLTREKTHFNPYIGLYKAKPTDNHYILPYFTDDNHFINQNWEENTNPVGKTIGGVVDFATKGIGLFKPAAGMAYPRSYTGSNPQNITISFTLFNTVDTGNDYDAIRKNKRFIERFIYRNLHDQNKVANIVPPCIYEVYIPGIKWMPAAVVSGLQITNKGTLNRIDDIDNGQYIIPDAWDVQIQMMELIHESKTMYNEAIKGNNFGGDINVSVLRPM